MLPGLTCEESSSSQSVSPAGEGEKKEPNPKDISNYSCNKCINYIQANYLVCELQ